MRPREVLQMQADLRESMLHEDWRRVGEWMIGSMEVQRAYADPLADDLSSDLHAARVNRWIKANPGTGQDFVDHQRRTLGLAEAYVVDEQMMGLVRMAAADYPEDMPTTPDMVPCPDGFLVFEKSWATTDVRGNEVKVKALTWATIPGGVLVTEYSSLTEPDDITRKMLSQPSVFPHLRALGNLHFHHQFKIRWNALMADGLPAEWDDIIRDSAVGPPKALLAVWHLMGQTYTDVQRARLTPKHRQGWRRKRIRGEVSVITLRRVKAEHVEHTGQVQYDHRWPVRGHWHGYWYGTGEGRALKKRYVHPYLKGPENAPIRYTKHVTRLSR